MEQGILRKNIADNIRIARARLRITQEKLAEMSNSTQQYINNIENEKVNLSVFVLVKIAEALDMSVNELIYKSN